MGCRPAWGRKSELHHGLRLAGVGALAIIFGIAAVALTLSAQQPLDTGAIPAISWLIVAGVSVYGSVAMGRYRVVPAATVAVLMLAKGVTLMGYRRSVLIVAAMSLLIVAVAPPANRAARIGGAIVGLVAGTALGLLNIDNLQNYYSLQTGPWVPNAQWQSTAEMVNIVLDRLAIVLALAGLLAALKRTRFAIAAMALSAPIFLSGLFTPGGLLWGFYYLQTSMQVAIATALNLVVLGLAIIVPWRRSQFDSQGRVDSQRRLDGRG